MPTRKKKSQNPAMRAAAIKGVEALWAVETAIDLLIPFKNAETMTIEHSEPLMPLVDKMIKLIKTLRGVYSKHCQQRASGEEAAATRGVGKPGKNKADPNAEVYRKIAELKQQIAKFEKAIV